VLDVSDPSHGKIKINSLLINDNTVGIQGSAYPWTGIYFQGIPVSIEAIPEQGYRFVRWEGEDSQSAILDLTFSSDKNLKAIFENDEHISVYPNPTSGRFFTQVENNSIGNGSLKVFDMMGKELYTISFYKSQYKIQVPVEVTDKSIPMGMYAVQVEIGGNFYRTKLIIER
jgi:hypothetical protein